MNRLNNDKGLGLIELTVIIVVIGILAVTAMRSMESTINDIKQVKTEREMEMLADGIVGDTKIGNGSSRTDFGYIGDVGAFPPNLDALLSNPGSYATWDGPYIEPGIAEDNIGFKTDEWGTAYSYTGGITITSTGSGSAISKKIADASSDYLLNTFTAAVKDASDSLPGTTYADSIDIIISIPNGSGGTASKTYNPDSTGVFTLDSLPVGTHPLRIIYKPNVDTLFRYLTILPRHKSGTVAYNFASNYFGGGGGGGGPGGIEYVSGTIGFNGGDCEEVTFDITNTSGSSITLTNMTVSWSSPTAWYDEIKFDGTKVWKQDSPSNSSGDVATFSSSQNISAGQTVSVLIKNFKDQNDGDGNNVNMSNVTFTITFSDGSTFNVTTGACP